jgi:nucleotide-binding universal stress UspA family protein
MFQHILVPLDGSPLAERALPVAALIARSTGASVELLHAASVEVGYGPYFAQAPSYVETILAAEMTGARAYLEQAARMETLAGIRSEIAIIPGPATTVIPVYAQFHDVDLIVMCSHGYSRAKRWMLGSVADRVVRCAPVPVLVLRDQEPVPARPHPGKESPLRAIVALDGSPLAEATLEPVTHLVAVLSASTEGIIHLLRIVEVSAAPHSSSIAHAHNDETRELALREAQLYLTSMIDRLRKGIAAGLNLSFTTSVITDTDVAQAIIQEGERAEKAGESEQLIAMSTHGRSGWQRLVLGSVTERVLHGTRLPVFVISPNAPVSKKALARNQEATEALSL